jgi:hypothetical protein
MDNQLLFIIIILVLFFMYNLSTNAVKQQHHRYHPDVKHNFSHPRDVTVFDILSLNAQQFEQLQKGQQAALYDQAIRYRQLFLLSPKKAVASMLTYEQNLSNVYNQIIKNKKA